jgi:hypothetical protein
MYEKSLPGRCGGRLLVNDGALPGGLVAHDVKFRGNGLLSKWGNICNATKAPKLRTFSLVSLQLAANQLLPKIPCTGNA